MITGEMQSIIAAEVSKQLRASRMGDGSASMRVDPYNIPFRNDSGEVIPPYAVMRPDALSTEGESQGNWFFKVVKPDDQFRRRYYINGPVAIPDGGFGMCSDGTYPTIASYGGGGVVDFQTPGGACEGSWKLNGAAGGVGAFTYIDDYGYKPGLYASQLALVVQSELTRLTVITDAEIEIFGTLACKIVDNGGTTNMEVDVYYANMISNLDHPASIAKIGNGAYCEVSYNHTRGVWYILTSDYIL